jgi:adenylosuccinate synthase
LRITTALKGEINNALHDFLEAIDKINWKIEGYDYLKSFNHLIFEGSQGILLDMDHGVFPNVTYANTTSKNAYEVCKLLKIKILKCFM